MGETSIPKVALRWTPADRRKRGRPNMVGSMYYLRVKPDVYLVLY